MLSYKDELMHYGVKGMRWGVRKERSRSKVNSIFNTMSGKEKYYLVDDEHAKEYATKEMYDPKTSSLVSSYIKYISDKPISFLDIYMNDPGVGKIAIGTDSAYRGHGNARTLAERAIADMANLPITELQWNAHPSNTASVSLAKSLGFVEDPSKSTSKALRLYYKKKSS